MVDVVDPNVFETANAGFAQAMYEEFLRDPAAVGPEWRRLFESGVVGERPEPNGTAAQAADQRREPPPGRRRLGDGRRLPCPPGRPPSRGPPPSSSPT